MSFFINIGIIFTLIFFFNYALLLVSSLWSRPFTTPYLLSMLTSHPLPYTRLLHTLALLLLLCQDVALTHFGKSPELKWSLADDVRGCHQGTLPVGSCSS